MKITEKKTNSSFRRFLVIVSILLGLALIYTGAAYALKLWPFSTTVQKIAPKPAATNPTPTTNGSTVTNPASTTTTTNTSKDSSTNTDSSQTTDVATITAANQGQGSDSDMLHIRALISGIKNTGTCTLTLTKGSLTDKLPAVGIQPGPSTSTCQGFDISISSEGLTPGVWKVTVNITSGTTQATAVGQVTIL